MIETAWKWAAEKGKLETNPVNGAEYATLPVDSERLKTKESTSSLSVKAETAFQDCWHVSS